jgi:hypothetical protein
VSAKKWSKIFLKERLKEVETVLTRDQNLFSLIRARFQNALASA